MRHFAVVLSLVGLVGCGSLEGFETMSAPVMAHAVDWYSAIDVLGIGDVYASSLREEGIRTVRDLLDTLSTRTGRNQVARATGISTKLLLRWANHADLMRITGVGPEFSRLLEKAGVDTVLELTGRNPHNLADAMAEANARYGFVDRLPSAATVAKWVNNARNLPAVMQY